MTMITTPKWLGLLAVAFVAGSFVASPELRAYAANTIGSADIINESILSADIKNGEVKAADIGTDAVGASELQGVTKLLFGQCSINNSVQVPPGSATTVNCFINGVDSDDSAVASINDGTGGCFDARVSGTNNGSVFVTLANECSLTTQIGIAKIGIIVFDK